MTINEKLSQIKKTIEEMKLHEKDINLQTVKNRIFRGRRIVKKQLESMKLFSEA